MLHGIIQTAKVHTQCSININDGNLYCYLTVFAVRIIRKGKAVQKTFGMIKITDETHSIPHSVTQDYVSLMPVTQPLC